ncbi:alpha/beta hydrolase [Mycoplasmatota bacterium WC44]
MRKVLASDVDVFEGVDIGGIKQFILARGNNESNPLILFLHGGPGMAQIGFMPHYQKILEEHFIVVNWDQRGAGLSFSDNIPKESMNTQQFIYDTIEVTNYLRKKYKKERIYLIGHSWGSLLGMKVIYEHPELFYHFIGVGHVADMWRVEELRYNFTKDMVIKENNTEAIKELEGIGYPPYKDGLNCIQVSSKWHAKYAKYIRTGDANTFITEGIKNSRYFSNENMEQWSNGLQFSINSLFKELFEANLYKNVKTVDVPVTFFGGRFDYTTFSSLASEYLDYINAPKKNFVWFEKSAHIPMLEESEEFQHGLVDLLL